MGLHDPCAARPTQQLTRPRNLAGGDTPLYRMGIRTNTTAWRVERAFTNTRTTPRDEQTKTDLDCHTSTLESRANPAFGGTSRLSAASSSVLEGGYVSKANIGKTGNTRRRRRTGFRRTVTRSLQELPTRRRRRRAWRILS